MKIINNNIYMVLFGTESYREYTQFVDNQKVNETLRLGDQLTGIYYHYFMVRDSLTGKNIFSISFSCDYEKNKLSVLLWEGYQLFVLNTGSDIYFIRRENNNDKIQIQASFDIFTSLIGLHITTGNNLLVLEEASLRLIAPSGKIILHHDFGDIIEDFDLEDNQLYVTIDRAIKTFELI